MTDPERSNVLPFPSRGGVEAVTTKDGKMLKKSFQVPAQLRKEMATEAQRRGDTGYSNRWAVTWGKTIRYLASYGDLTTLDLPRVVEYIQRKRFEELHLLEAEANPYQTYDSGYVQVHPGFSQARAEAAAARQVLAEIREDVAKRSRVPDDPDDDGDAADKAFDDQVGPDGERL
jgi:hypothetical protein